MPAPTLHPALARSDFPLLATFSSQAVPVCLLHLPVLLVDGLMENSWTGPSPNVQKGMPGHRVTTNAATLPHVQWKRRSLPEGGKERLLRKLKLSFLARVKQAACYLQHCCHFQESELFASVWFCCVLPLKQVGKVKQSLRKAQGAGAGQETKPAALIPNNDWQTKIPPVLGAQKRKTKKPNNQYQTDETACTFDPPTAA